jgi:hypothetical protein
VDYLIIEFPAGQSNFTSEMAKELVSLAEAGTIRVIDILILVKDADGSVEAMELSDLEDMGELQVLEAELAELLAEDDVLRTETGRRTPASGASRRRRTRDRTAHQWARVRTSCMSSSTRTNGRPNATSPFISSSAASEAEPPEELSLCNDVRPSPGRTRSTAVAT